MSISNEFTSGYVIVQQGKIMNREMDEKIQDVSSYIVNSVMSKSGEDDDDDDYDDSASFIQWIVDDDLQALILLRGIFRKNKRNYIRSFTCVSCSSEFCSSLYKNSLDDWCSYVMESIDD